MGPAGSWRLEWVSLTADALKAFEALKHMRITAPVLAFADYTKPFLLETDACKDGLRQCCHRSRHMGSATLSPMEAGPLHLMRRTTIQLSSVCSIEVGGYRAFQGEPALPVFPGEDG